MRRAVLIIAIIWPFISGFTLISGVNEATLPSTPSNPEVTFFWDGSHPKIQNKEDFDNGRYSDLSDEEFMSVMLGEAFGVWNDVKGSYLEMVVEKDEDVEIDADDNKNVIMVKSVDNLATAAFARPEMDDDYETIEDCDITMGDIDVEAKDLGYYLAHEIGHCVGLGHDHTNRKALMGYTRSDHNLYLGADDKAGLIYLYLDPKYEGDDFEFLACASIGSLNGASSALLILMLMLPVLFTISGLFCRRA